MRSALLPVRRHELAAVAPRLTRAGIRALIADKVYDADVLRADLAERGAQAVMPPQANRIGAVECGREMYPWHRLVENFFCNPKRFRRIHVGLLCIVHIFATRCGKTGSSYRGMIHGVGACVALA